MMERDTVLYKTAILIMTNVDAKKGNIKCRITIACKQYIILYIHIIYIRFYFLGMHLRHMKFPRLGVELEL